MIFFRFHSYFHSKDLSIQTDMNNLIKYPMNALTTPLFRQGEDKKMSNEIKKL